MKPNLSKPGGADHVVYPYLLRYLLIERPNQVWGQAEHSSCRVDITYIRMTKGWMYLVAFLDWYSRYVQENCFGQFLCVAWELSDSLELPFVLSCRESALAHAVPEIINSDRDCASDQGSHYSKIGVADFCDTSERFTRRFLEAGVKISMDARASDGRGRYMDNIFTERLWRSVKYEEIYLSEYGTPKEAREGLGRYFTFYNEVRPHQALGYATPAEIHAMSPKKG